MHAAGLRLLLIRLGVRREVPVLNDFAFQLVCSSRRGGLPLAVHLERGVIKLVVVLHVKPGFLLVDLHPLILLFFYDLEPCWHHS